jgi:uncharacterized protein YjbI with pentapeptide repeats
VGLKGAMLAEYEAHRRWLVSGRSIGKRIKWSGRDLSNIDLSGLDLSYATMCHVIMGGEICHTAFDSADMTGALIGRAKFLKCSMLCTHMYGVDIYKTTFDGCSMERVMLSTANIKDSEFIDPMLSRAVLHQTNIDNVKGLVAVKMHDSNMLGYARNGKAFVLVDMKEYPLDEFECGHVDELAAIQHIRKEVLRGSQVDG